jgi:hypothetical protein
VVGSAAFGGAGVVAQNTGAGGVALRLDNGGIRVTGAAPVFSFNTASALICTDAAGHADAVIDNVYTNGEPDAFLFPVVSSPNSQTEGVFGVFYSGGGGSGFCPANRWLLFQALNGEFRDVDTLVRFNILVVNR